MLVRGRHVCMAACLITPRPMSLYRNPLPMTRFIPEHSSRLPVVFRLRVVSTTPAVARSHSGMSSYDSAIPRTDFESSMSGCHYAKLYPNPMNALDSFGPCNPVNRANTRKRKWSHKPSGLTGAISVELDKTMAAKQAPVFCRLLLTRHIPVCTWPLELEKATTLNLRNVHDTASVQ